MASIRWYSFSISLLLALTLSSSATAQQSASNASSTSGERTAVRLAEEPSAVGRYFAEGGLGLAGGAVGALSGAVSGGTLGLLLVARDPSDEDPFVAAIIGGALIGSVVGTTSGVTTAGQWMDTYGSSFSTFLGASGGMLAGAVLGAATGEPAPAIVLGSVASLAGAMIGYELSLPDSHEFTSAHAPILDTAPWVAVSPSEDGVQVSVGARF